MINTFYSEVTVESAITLQTSTIIAPVYEVEVSQSPVLQTSTQSSTTNEVTVTTNFDYYDL